MGNGSDEAIDLVYRAFCRPGVDNVVAIDPTYGMYQVCAEVNDVEYRKVLLDENYQFTADRLLAATDDNTKLIFLCSPNNPTGNALDREEMEKTLSAFQGLVVIDEAYSDFRMHLRFCLTWRNIPISSFFRLSPKPGDVPPSGWAWHLLLLKLSRFSVR